MKKTFKSMVAIAIISTMLMGTASVAFASEPGADEFSKSDYDVYEVTFPQMSYSSDTSTSNNNVSEAIDFVYSLNLEDKGYVGLEEACINELETISDNGNRLDSYAVYLPKSDTYYGTYDGYRFRASFSVYNESYQRTLTGKANHEAWVSGAINMVMSFANWKIGLPYAVFSSLSGVDDIRYYDGSWSDLTISDEVTSRYIWIEDKDHKISVAPDSYVIVLNDMCRVTRPVLVTYPNSPYADPSIDATFDREQVPSSNYYNPTKTMHTGLRYYISGDLNWHIKDLVPRASLNWD